MMGVLEKYGIKKEDWFYLGQWEQPLLNASFWLYAYDKNICEALGVGGLKGWQIVLNGHFLELKEDLDLLRKQTIKACTQNERAFFQRFYQKSLDILHKHRALADAFEQNEDDDGALLSTFLTSTKKMMVPWLIGLYFSDFIGDILVEKAEKLGVPATRIIDYIPKKETMMIKEYHEALEIKRLLNEKGFLAPLQKSLPNALGEIKKDAVLWHKVQEHVGEYEWIGTHHLWGEPLTVKKFLSEVLILKEKEGVHRAIPRDLPNELQFILDVAGNMMFLRQYSAEVFDLVAFKARPLFEIVRKKLKMGPHEFLLLTAHELEEYLEKQKLPSEDAILRRSCSRWRSWSSVEAHAATIAVRPMAFAMYPNPFSRSSVLVNLSSGSFGIVVFLVPENLSKMREGDILVTTMTTPDFVPLMKKAAAIVTDIGGLLSHAAIVSREMGKPCVVGTGIATKVLKDGDLVEVDATNGIVRIYKEE